MTNICIIAGLTKKRVIGKEGKLPWHIPEDLKNFKKLTSGQVVVMGRKTFESILSFLGKPLPNRVNIVVSRTMEGKKGIGICRSFEEAMEQAKLFGKDIFIIGGTSMFAEGLKVADKLFLSWVKKAYEGDVYFPEFDMNDWEVIEEKDFGEFVLKVYSRK